jgi:uncharacterized NAD(P)/FAD-binding protein YdhS
MKTILIAGAGFSGTMTAIQLLRQCGGQNIKVLLVERGPVFGPGLAYGRAGEGHLLNVPLGNMSALPDQPLHFLQFCQARQAPVHAASFVPRELYGQYLAQLLQQAQQARPGMLECIVGDVQSLQPQSATTPDGPLRVTLDQGRVLLADQVVLATGNAPPAHLPLAASRCDGGFYHSSRYVPDPWSAQALAACDGKLPILLLGTGLGTVDISASLLAHLPNRVLALSRHGLLPQAHRIARSTAPMRPLPDLLRPVRGLREKLAMLRQHIRQGAELGEDWRDVIAALRSDTSALWQSLSQAEQRQFLRHVRPYWDAHRHRVAPPCYDKFISAIQHGHLQLLAGRIRSLRESATGVIVCYQPRGADTEQQLEVARVINCTGPATHLAASESPLIHQLLDDGWICGDPHYIGIATDSHFATLNRAGQANPRLHYIGPGLRARHWEATAVPELRQFAAQLAAILLARTSDT